MSWLFRRRDQKLLGLVLVVLVLAVGFCLFDGGEHEHGNPRPDLCLGMLATVMTLTLVARLPLAGLASVEHIVAVLERSLRVPAPPPKTALS
jgi:hypothetical protein